MEAWAKAGGRCCPPAPTTLRLLRLPELEDGVLSRLRNPIFLTGVELLFDAAAAAAEAR